MKSALQQPHIAVTFAPKGFVALLKNVSVPSVYRCHTGGCKPKSDFSCHKDHRNTIVICHLNINLTDQCLSLTKACSSPLRIPPFLSLQSSLYSPGFLQRFAVGASCELLLVYDFRVSPKLSRLF